MKTQYQLFIDQIESAGKLDETAKKLGTSINYLTGHLYYATREPKLRLAFKIHKESRIPMDILVNHFERPAA